MFPFLHVCWEYKFLDPEKRITHFHFQQEMDLFIKCSKCFWLQVTETPKSSWLKTAEGILAPVTASPEKGLESEGVRAQIR